jgi:Ca2+-binding RTX toxin-like protein
MANANASILDTSIAFNSATSRGAGISLGSLAQADSVTITRTTIAHNAGGPGSWGGGIYAGGVIDGQLAVRDSTISTNEAGGGAGISIGDFNLDSLVIGAHGSIAVQNSTVASNNAGGSGGGLYLAEYSGGGGPRIDLLSTIVADNLATGAPEDLDSAGVASGGTVRASFTLVEAPGDAPISIGPGGQNIFGVDPRLGSLQANGGPTATHLPDDDSPVIDRGLSRPGDLTDQRILARPVDNPGVVNAPGGDGADIGAVEIENLPGSLGLCRGEEVTLLAGAPGSTTVGTPGRDVVLGTEGADTIQTLGGSDLICGAGGDDVVHAGPGSDTALGSGGNDHLFGQSGSDVLIGGSGRDQLGGSAGADRLFGLKGDDHLAGGGGPDGLYGHAGRDVLLGGGASDDAFGGPGKDRLKGGPGRDHLRGGPGRDVEIQ